MSDLLRVASFNVNGIRAAQRRGFSDWLGDRRPDIVALQEMRAPANHVPEGVFGDLHVAYHPGNLPGRNGVAIAARVAPTAVRQGFGNRTFDPEGVYRRRFLAGMPAGRPAQGAEALAYFRAVPRSWRLDPGQPRPVPAPA